MALKKLPKFLHKKQCFVLLKIFQIFVKLTVCIDHILLAMFCSQKQLLFQNCSKYLSESCVIMQQQTTAQCKQTSLVRGFAFLQMKAFISPRNDSINEWELKLQKKGYGFCLTEILSLLVLHKCRSITKCFQSGGTADKTVASNQMRVPALSHALSEPRTQMYVKKML